MTKDAAANLTSLTGLTAVLMEWQLPLTILLITTGIVLNVVRIYSATKKKED